MKGLLLDTNILMLLVVGSVHRNLVAAHRRTAVFSADDFDLLQDQLQKYRPIRTTASILTETSNLLGNDFHEVAAPVLVKVCTPFFEVVKAKELVFEQEGFQRLGFGDASILAALDDESAVLTDDLQLYTQVLYMGYEAINFNHLRTFRD